MPLGAGFLGAAPSVPSHAGTSHVAEASASINEQRCATFSECCMPA
jgi:hypothetical protein